MIIVSHRGNLDGKSEWENHPTQILKSLEYFPVEIDVWYINESWYLGHDKPDYKISFSFFTPNMYLHCKNSEALEKLEDLNVNLKYFWQTNENFSLIRNDKLWCNYNIYLKNGITVTLEYKEEINKKNIYGICTDYPLSYIKNA